MMNDNYLPNKGRVPFPEEIYCTVVDEGGDESFIGADLSPELATIGLKAPMRMAIYRLVEVRRVSKSLDQFIIPNNGKLR